MKNLRKKFHRYCNLNRDKGIPNLMLYVMIGSGIVYLLTNMGYRELYEFLCFDREKILQGQVWRLFTYVFIQSSTNAFFSLLLYYCYASLGRAVEAVWGTLRFNLFYFSGVLLMDVFAMVLGGIAVPITSDGYTFMMDCSLFYSAGMVQYLNLSLLIAFATMFPDTQFYVLFIIPVRAWILALIYLLVTGYDILTMSAPHLLFPHNLFPLVGRANYFQFFGKDAKNLLPLSRRVQKKKTPRWTASGGPIPFRPAEKKEDVPYTHRCTVCGKTDVSHPNLEFRYCSRCNGNHCYCEEHINNHSHID